METMKPLTALPADPSSGGRNNLPYADWTIALIGGRDANDPGRADMGTALT